jgi:hypothetical protein
VRLLTTIVSTAGFSGIAVAHSLADGEDQLARLTHELFGLHHLPVLMMLLVAWLLFLRRTRQARRSPPKIADS